MQYEEAKNWVQTDREGLTPLHWAAVMGNKECISLALDPKVSEDCCVTSLPCNFHSLISQRTERSLSGISTHRMIMAEHSCTVQHVAAVEH